MPSLSEKQMQILAFPFTDYDMLICDGAVRSGKSSIMTVAFVDWAMRDFTNCNFILAGKTVGSCVKNIVRPYITLDYAKEKYSISFKRSENLLVISKGRNTNNFYIYGGKDESSQDLIQGLTAAGALLDEAALMPESFFNQAIARCSVKGSKIWQNCNPSDPNNFVKKNWIDKAEQKNVLHLHFTMRDNPSLDEKTIKRYENMFTGIFYNRYILGLWVRAEGVVFPEFANNPDKWDIDRQEILSKKFMAIEIGFDLGGNKSAYAVTVSAIDWDNQVYFLYSKKTQAQDLNMSEVRKLVEDAVLCVKNTYNLDVDYINVDHIDVVVNEINQNTPYRAGKTYKPPLEDRVFLFSRMFATNQVHFVKDMCNDLKDELQDLIFDDKKERAIPLDDGTVQLDAYDSASYSISGSFHRLTD